jgi:hypothetical protein
MMNSTATDGLERAWSEMLKFFRALGGVADNVEPRGQSRGLFAIDPTQPVALSVPTALLVNVDDVEFVGDLLRLKSSADVMDAQRLFFGMYHDALTWVRYGRRECAKFVAALDSLPETVRAVLIEDFGCEDLLVGDPALRTQQQFLRCSSIRRGDAEYLVPMLDLANYDAAGLAFQFGHGELSAHGETRDEVLIASGVHDSLSAFRSFGVARPEPGAFSLPVGVNPRPPEIFVGRDMERLSKRGATWAPQIDIGDGQVALSCLMIGHVRFPKLSRGLFRALLREVAYPDPDDAFDRILNYNWTRYLKLLETLEPHHGEMITTLRNMARHQLETMSHCIGSRELNIGTAPPEPDPEPDADNRPAEQTWQLSIQ